VKYFIAESRKSYIENRLHSRTRDLFAIAGVLVFLTLHNGESPQR